MNDKIIIDPAPEGLKIALSDLPHHRECGTMYRGCSPNCLNDAAERGMQYQAKRDAERIRKHLTYTRCGPDCGRPHIEITELNNELRTLAEEIEDDAGVVSL